MKNCSNIFSCVTLYFLWLSFNFWLKFVRYFNYSKLPIMTFLIIRWGTLKSVVPAESYCIPILVKFTIPGAIPRTHIPTVGIFLAGQQEEVLCGVLVILRRRTLPVEVGLLIQCHVFHCCWKLWTTILAKDCLVWVIEITFLIKVLAYRRCFIDPLWHIHLQFEHDCS